jgi:hypothetical protein
MAVKKSAKGAGKAAPKTVTTKGAKAQTAVKAGTPKAKAKESGKGKTAAKAAARKKKAPPVKLTDKQRDLLNTIHNAGEAGYGSKAQQKRLDALHGKKLLKRGPKNKTTGVHHYTVTKAGQKHLRTPAVSSAPAPAPSAPAPTPAPAVSGGTATPPPPAP